MDQRPYTLPSFKALTAFEAAARHLSFRAAAREINVTPGAISHQVRALEKDLKTPLFLRENRGVSLTADGSLLFLALQKSFGDISAVWRDLKPAGQDRSVRICATTAVSSLWLTTRLVKFWQDHPDIAVDQSVIDQPISNTAGFDLMIAYGEAHKGLGTRHALFRDMLVPLCSPSFAEKHRACDLSELAQLPLIHLVAADDRWTSWRSWFDHLGHSDPIASGPRMNNYITALQTAQDGAGLVLGWRHLVRPRLEAGSLVAFTDYQVLAPEAFFVLSPSDDDITADAATVRNWLVDHL